jgi:hypothetical protein
MFSFVRFGVQISTLEGMLESRRCVRKKLRKDLQDAHEEIEKLKIERNEMCRIWDEKACFHASTNQVRTDACNKHLFAENLEMNARKCCNVFPR